MAELRSGPIVHEERLEAQIAAERLKDLGVGTMLLLNRVADAPDRFPSAKTWSSMRRRNRERWSGELCGILGYEDLMPGSWEQRILTPPTWETLSTAIDDYHDAIPFSAPELEWLEARYRDNDPDTHDWLDEEFAVYLLTGIHGEITEGGQHQEVQSSALVERWWAWRRGAEVPEATGSFELANAALHRIAVLTLHPETLKLPFD